MDGTLIVISLIFLGLIVFILSLWSVSSRVIVPPPPLEKPKRLYKIGDDGELVPLEEQTEHELRYRQEIAELERRYQIEVADRKAAYITQMAELRRRKEGE